ncbi:hypothetical protein Pmani_032548 [Petrolisthes manimaculis]|uniref:Uncharacterized protein n=1 Tax=Petrolisthes manimaculis TaxID=1843537 RepID=A0AAE1NT35_9EUCA|nr:hypothetical protein Pmani_032548 [Petrolisthes manimaculis]
MKYSKESPAGGMLVPLEYKSLNLLMKGCDKNMALARALQKERRRNKRREKENMWKRNNQRNAMQEPIVMHYPASQSCLALLALSCPVPPSMPSVCTDLFLDYSPQTTLTGSSCPASCLLTHLILGQITMLCDGWMDGCSHRQGEVDFVLLSLTPDIYTLSSKSCRC